MKTIETLRKQLESIGATLDDSSDYTLNCNSPSGYLWSANGCTCIAIHYATNSQQWLVKAVREDGLPRLRMGLYKASPEELKQARHGLGDDTWGAKPDAPEKIEWPK